MRSVPLAARAARPGILMPLALVAAVLAACTDGSADPRPDGTDARHALVAGGDSLSPGTYVVEGFSRPFSFRVEEHTWVARQVERDIVTLIGPRTELQIATPRLVYEKGPAFVPRPAPLPQDLVRWIGRLEDLTSTAPSRVEVAGVAMSSLEVEVHELYEEAELLGCPLPCFPLAAAGGPEPLFLTHTHRVTVDEGDPPLVIVYGTGDRAGERAAEDLLASLRFRG